MRRQPDERPWWEADWSAEPDNAEESSKKTSAKAEAFEDDKGQRNAVHRRMSLPDSGPKDSGVGEVYTPEGRANRNPEKALPPERPGERILLKEVLERVPAPVRKRLIELMRKQGGEFYLERRRRLFAWIVRTERLEVSGKSITIEHRASIRREEPPLEPSDVHSHLPEAGPLDSSNTRFWEKLQSLTAKLPEKDEVHLRWHENGRNLSATVRCGEVTFNEVLPDGGPASEELVGEGVLVDERRLPSETSKTTRQGEDFTEVPMAEPKLPSSSGEEQEVSPVGALAAEALPVSSDNAGAVPREFLNWAEAADPLQTTVPASEIQWAKEQIGSIWQPVDSELGDVAEKEAPTTEPHFHFKDSNRPPEIPSQERALDDQASETLAEVLTLVAGYAHLLEDLPPVAGGSPELDQPSSPRRSISRRSRRTPNRNTLRRREVVIANRPASRPDTAENIFIPVSVAGENATVWEPGWTEARDIPGDRLTRSARKLIRLLARRYHIRMTPKLEAYLLQIVLEPHNIGGRRIFSLNLNRENLIRTLAVIWLNYGGRFGG